MTENGNGNGNGPQNPWGSDKFEFKKPNIKFDFKVPGGLSFLFLVIAVVYFGSGFYIVKPNEQAVVKRFGKVIEVVDPGPHYRLPFPIDSVDKAEVTKIHRIEIGFTSTAGGGYRSIPREALMLTGDENIISIDMIVQYKISSLKDYLYNVNDVEGTIKDSAESTIREVAGREKIDDLLTVGKNRIQMETLKILQDIMKLYETGITIVAVQLQDVEPPKEVVGSFKDVASAREDKNRYINEAEAYQNELIPRARAEAETVLQKAEAYESEQIARAMGETARFIDVMKNYKLAPAITKKRLYLENMAEVLKGGNKYIFDEKLKNINAFLGLEGMKTNQGGSK